MTDTPDDQQCENLPAKVRRLATSDQTRAWVLAWVSALPRIGSPLAILLDFYLPDQRTKRLDAFIQDFGNRLADLEDRIAIDLSRSEEFGMLLEHSLLSVARTRDKRKIEAYRNILLNFAVGKAPEEALREFFVDQLQSMREVHFELLALPAAAVSGDTSKVQQLLERLRAYEPAIVRNAVSEMGSFIKGFGGGNLATIIINSALGHEKYIAETDTELGQRFRDFITVPDDDGSETSEAILS